MKAIAYARVSTREQADKGLSLDVQHERIRAYCAMKELTLIDIVDDPGESGGKPLALRTGGKALLDRITRDDVKHVVVLRLDRAFRRALDCLQHSEAWEKNGVSLHLLDVGGNALDISTAVGKFMLTMIAGAAALTRDLTRENTRNALAFKKKNGLRAGALPFGFDLADDSETLLPNLDEQRIIAEVQTMRSRGMSFPKIAASLTQRNIPTKHGNGHWSQSTIRGLLRRAEAVTRL